jgi:hypothetical protein
MHSEPEPVILPDVDTEPHPPAHAIPEPPGADADQQQEVVLDHNEPAETEERGPLSQPSVNTGPTAADGGREPAPIDQAFDELHRAGWSVGEIGSRAGWLAYARKGRVRLFARADAQTEAWQEVLEQARAHDRGPPGN